ncbi:MAG: DUF2254 domain-containing protein [Sphingobium sp.]
MIARLRSWWMAVNASYWFYPALFSILAAIGAFTAIMIDRSGATQWLTDAEWLSPARPEGARNILTVIAGSMIGVASTVFSITIAAVAYASGNYGPRLLTNFMEDRGNQLSLGTFIATFVFAVIVLRAVRGAEEGGAGVESALAAAGGFVPQLSLALATVLAAVAIAVLVFFLNHIPSSIRINIVLQGIGERLIDDIERRYPDRDEGFEPDGPPRGLPVTAKGRGYVQYIDHDGLADLAEECGGRFALRLRTGDFAHPAVPLVDLIGLTPNDDLPDRVRRCFALGGMRTPVQDPEFLIDELVEIALRALSPGINDPFTAITAMHWLGAATAELAGRDLSKPLPSLGDKAHRVILLSDDFDHFLSRGFGALRASAAASALASKQFLDCLESVATMTGPRRRERLAGEAERLLEQARLHLKGPSLAELEARLLAFRKRTEI